MPFTLMDLPFDRDALAPHMSEETLDFHHGKHHRKYVDTLNQFVHGTPLEHMSLEEVIFESAFAPAGAKIFNNAAQVWNHDMFWKSLTPKGGGEPADDELMTRIDASFGSFRAFKKKFAEAAAGQFGMSPLSLALWTIPGRLWRFVAFVAVFGSLQRAAHRLRGAAPRMRLGVWALFWIIVYVRFWAG